MTPFQFEEGAVPDISAFDQTVADQRCQGKFRGMRVNTGNTSHLTQPNQPWLIHQRAKDFRSPAEFNSIPSVFMKLLYNTLDDIGNTHANHISVSPVLQGKQTPMGQEAGRMLKLDDVQAVTEYCRVPGP